MPRVHPDPSVRPAPDSPHPPPGGTCGHGHAHGHLHAHAGAAVGTDRVDRMPAGAIPARSFADDVSDHPVLKNVQAAGSLLMIPLVPMIGLELVTTVSALFKTKHKPSGPVF